MRDDAIPPIADAVTYVDAMGQTHVIALDLGTPRVDPHGPPRVPPARLSPRGDAIPVGARYRPATPPPNQPQGSDPDFDNPAVGGKFTVFTLLYGDYPDMHRQGLGSLVATLAEESADRSELRVISNALGGESRRYVRSLQDQGRIAVWIDHPDNRLKYGAMRAAFRDPDRPITTPYLIWADDDTMFDVDRHWLRTLARDVRDHHADGYRLYGPRYLSHLTPGQIAWYRDSRAYQGLPFQDRAGAPAVDGAAVHFASGSFWALCTDTMRAADVPDARLRHNGGDVWTGWAVYQHGGKLRPFATGKTTVRWSAFRRRGYSEPHPGTV